MSIVIDTLIIEDPNDLYEFPSNPWTHCHARFYMKNWVNNMPKKACVFIEGYAASIFEGYPKCEIQIKIEGDWGVEK